MNQIRQNRRKDLDDNYIINQYNLGRDCQDIANELNCDRCTIRNKLKKYKIKLRNNSIHNMTNTRLYNIWSGMKARCYDKNHPKYNRYGARSITVCERWLIFQNFYNDMIDGYSNKLSIDRIDNDGNYCLENCKWSTNKEQQQHTSKTHYLTFNNKIQTISQWAEELKIPYNTLHNRIINGWSIERALTTPCKGIRRCKKK